MKNLIFILMTLTSIFTFANECGLSGSIQAKIADCNKVSGDFILVTKNDYGEVYLDRNLGILWGDKLPTDDISQYRAEETCKSDRLRRMTGIDAQWRLPALAEFEAAEVYGVREFLPNMKHDGFWTSTLLEINPDSAWLFAGGIYYRTFHVLREYGDYTARCVLSLTEHNF